MTRKKLNICINVSDTYVKTYKATSIIVVRNNVRGPSVPRRDDAAAQAERAEGKRC